LSRKDKKPPKPPTANDLKVYADQLKKQARDNVQHPEERLRIAWQHRWKRPLYESYLDYTPEELIVELHEQYFYENPDALENQGLFKKRNPKTNLVYYETGDPTLDALEKEFGEGKVPDLQRVFGDIKDGKDIFDEVRRKPFVSKDKKDEKIRQADNFKSNEWLDSAKEEDPFIQKMEDFVRGD